MHKEDELAFARSDVMDLDTVGIGEAVLAKVLGAGGICNS